MERGPQPRGTRAARTSPDRRRRLAAAARTAAAAARLRVLAPAGDAVRAWPGASARMGGALAAAAATLALVMVTQLLDFEAWDLRVRLLDSSYEWSWSHLVSTAAMGAGAVLCALGARAARPGRRGRAWRVAAVLFAVLFADSVTRLHEHVPHWPVVYAPIVAGLGAAVVVVAFGRPAALLVAAAVALLCASFVIHVAGPSVVRALGWAPYGFAFQVKVALKEGSELGGWVMLLMALAWLAQPRRADA